MEFRVLGPLEVLDDGAPLALAGAKQRALLAILLLNANEVVSSDRLIDGLWGEAPPKTAAKSLQVLVSQLRSTLEPDRPAGEPGHLLVTRPPGYLLRLEPEQLDLERFRRLASEGRAALAAGDPLEAAEKLRDGLALWRGTPLADSAYADFAQREISRLEELRLAALEDRIQADLECGRHAEVIGELESVVAEDPLRERPRAQLVLALYRSGRQAEALEAYSAARQVLVDELGIEPGRELKELQAAVLEQDPALELKREKEPSFVTIMFTDLVGSESLFQRESDEAADAVRREHFAALRRAVAGHGGREVRSTGDGLMVAFSSAVAAVRCAIDMQRATAAIGQLELSVGLDAGEPLPEGDELYGTPVIVASRLCDTAAPGEILASDLVCQVAGRRVAELIHPVGATRLRGVGERVVIAQVAWREEPGLELSQIEPTAPARQISVVIADDERLIRSGFRVILDAEPDIDVVGEAGDGRDAVGVVSRRRPDVCLMDIRMPELDGLAAADRILSDPELDTAVLMLTTFDLREYVYEALRIGASGFLLKDAPADRLIEAVRVVASGDALLAPSITRSLIEQFARAARPEPGEVPAALAELSSRELGVLRLVARGLSNAEIATELVLAENTIKTHVAHVLGKLGLRDRVQAVVLAYETGLVARELSADGES